MTHRVIALTITASCACLAGCGAEQRPAAESFGKTFYLDGAGNWGFGVHEVPAGLKDAGYHGDVEVYIWTTSLLPMVDQLNIGAAKLRAAALTQRIKDYRRRHPDRPINMIALSAGTGVLIWAIEGLDAGTRVNNVVLLGSSLSSDYDVTRALKNINGKIYVYHSPHDEVLAAVRVIGTIDGKRGVDSAGQVGLRVPQGARDRVVNVGWNERYMRFGWTGAHTDCTNRRFVGHIVARHVLNDNGARSTSGRDRHGDSSHGHAVVPAPLAGHPIAPSGGRVLVLSSDEDGRENNARSQAATQNLLPSESAGAAETDPVSQQR